jgi:hypothetical protein
MHPQTFCLRPGYSLLEYLILIDVMPKNRNWVLSNQRDHNLKAAYVQGLWSDSTDRKPSHATQAAFGAEIEL